MGEAKRRRAQQTQASGTDGIPPFADPVRRTVEFLCQEALLELQALARNDAAYLAERGGVMPSSESERAERAQELTNIGKALAVASEQGAFDDPVHGPVLLAEHARRLGERYVAMLPMVDEPTHGSSSDGPWSAAQLQSATQIHTRMRQLESAGMTRMEIMAEMYDYMPSFRRLMDTLHHDEFNALCRRFDGLWRYAKLLENLARDIRDGRVEVPR